MRVMCVKVFVLFTISAFIIASGSAIMGQDKSSRFLDQITKALPDKAPATPKQPHKMLIFSKTAGYRHGSIPTGIKAITMMGDKTGAYTAHATEDESFFEPEKLKTFDIVFMLNTTGDIFRPKTGTPEEMDARENYLKKSLVDFVAGGKALAGVHAATDTYAAHPGDKKLHDWKEYTKMIGGAFANHPWNVVTVPVKNMDPKNPVNAAFDGKDFTINDEIYTFVPTSALASDQHFLLSVDTAKFDTKKSNRPDGLYGISWISTYGKGRTFYCSLGHRDEIFCDPNVLKHYLAGIQYALGDLEADATPTAPVTEKK